FAANSLVGESMEKPLTYFDNNVHGTQVLLEIMTEFNVQHIVFSSTAAVYGEPDAIPITEDMPTEPTNAYGETKLTMEKLMKWMSNEHPLNFVFLRYYNVAGARETAEISENHRPETHLVPIIFKIALGQRANITLFSDDYNSED